jgi:hypothetical protein
MFCYFAFCHNLSTYIVIFTISKHITNYTYTPTTILIARPTTIISTGSVQ